MIMRVIWLFIMMWMVVAISTAVSAAVGSMSAMASKMLPR